MLRILHTADWHLGHSLANHSREFEHASFLAWLGKTIVSEGVDALLVAGDVFDSANPPASALSMYYEFLAEMSRRAPHLQILIIGGNHDSAARLNAPKPLLSALGVQVVGGVSGWSFSEEDYVFPLKNRQGEIAAQVAALPFLRASHLPPAKEGEVCGQDDRLIAGVERAYARVCKVARDRGKDGQALIAMGHCYMVGGALSELSERRILGGNQHALPLGIFPKDLAYVALGHLHKAQRVGHRESVRYSGSPIPLSMTEKEYRHQVVIADFEGGELEDWRGLEIPRAVAMYKLSVESIADLASGLDELQGRHEEKCGGASDSAPAPFLELEFLLKKPEPNLREELYQALEGKNFRLVRFSTVYTGVQKSLGEQRPRTRLADLDPQEVLRRRYNRDFEGEVPSEILAAFDELLDSLDQERA